MKFLMEDLGLFRSKNDIYYVLPRYGLGYNEKQQKAKIPLPQSFPLRYSELTGYHKVCAVQSFKHDIYICAIPKIGGDYLILKENATLDDVSSMLKYDGLRRIVEEAFSYPITPISESKLIKID